MLNKDNFQRYGQQIREMLQHLDWHETRESVHQESRARIVLLGLRGAGKSTLLNQICGWTVSKPHQGEFDESQSAHGLAEPVEDFGLFCLADLPANGGEAWLGYGNGWGGPDGATPVDGFSPGFDPLLSLNALDPLSLAEGADLLIYVLDGQAGVQPADYRWVGRLRRLGLPLLVVLNKSDLLGDDLPVRQKMAETRLATTVLPVSAQDNQNVPDLLPKMTALCPKLAVPLGRELRGFRQRVADLLIRRAAVVNAVVALEPIPLIDIPIQLMTLTGLMLRLGAVYERPASDLRRREVIAAVAGGLAGRYGAQQLAKLAPVVGWLVSSFIAWSCTWAMGRAAIAYFEAGGDEVIDQRLGQVKARLSRTGQAVSARWQRRPRLRLEWEREEES